MVVKKQTSSFRSTSLVINYQIKRILLETQQVLRQKKLQKQKVCSCKKVSITLTYCLTQKLSHMTLFTVIFVAVTFFKPKIRTLLTCSRMVWHKKAVINLKLSKPPLTGSESYQYLQQVLKQEHMRSFKNLSAGITKRMLNQLRRHSTKCGLLPRQTYRYVEAGLYIKKPSQYLSTQINRC